MKKTFVYVLLAVMMFTVLSGCGEMGSKGSDTPKNSPAVTDKTDDMMPDVDDGVVNDGDGIITDGDTGTDSNGSGMGTEPNGGTGTGTAGAGGSTGEGTGVGTGTGTGTDNGGSVVAGGNTLDPNSGRSAGNIGGK